MYQDDDEDEEFEEEEEEEEFEEEEENPALEFEEPTELQRQIDELQGRLQQSQNIQAARGRNNKDAKGKMK